MDSVISQVYHATCSRNCTYSVAMGSRYLHFLVLILRFGISPRNARRAISVAPVRLATCHGICQPIEVPGSRSVAENVTKARRKDMRPSRSMRRKCPKLLHRGVRREGIPLMVDTNCPWTPEEARQRALRFLEYDLHRLEEPIFPPEISTRWPS